MIDLLVETIAQAISTHLSGWYHAYLTSDGVLVACMGRYP